MSTIEVFDDLVKRTSFSSDDELLAFFDSLPVLTVEEMLSKWKGGDFKTGHWAEEELKNTKWFGKWFKTDLDGIPLVSYNDEGNLYSNLMMNGQSSLWMIEFRGKVSVPDSEDIQA